MRACIVTALLTGSSILSGCGLFGSASTRSSKPLSPPAVSDISPVEIKGDHNLLHNSDFDSGTLMPWMVSWGGKARDR